MIDISSTPDDPTAHALDALTEMIPATPTDSPNAPLLRRIEAALGAAVAIADALPDNHDPASLADAAALVAEVRGAADRIERRLWEVTAQTPWLSPNWRLPTFSEARAGGL